MLPRLTTAALDMVPVLVTAMDILTSFPRTALLDLASTFPQAHAFTVVAEAAVAVARLKPDK